MDGIDFTQLVLLLLPGFWSLWIYAPFTGYGFKALEWQEKAMMALGFGVFNMALFAVIDLYLYKIDGIEAQFLTIGILSVISGFISGILAKNELAPNRIYHKMTALAGRGAASTPYEKALDYYDARHKDICEGECAIMKVYPIGEKEKAVVGQYTWGYGKTGEVLLTWTAILKEFDLTRLCKSAIINDPVNNRIFEIYPLTKIEMQNILDEGMSGFLSA
jgi:hypothetical protein